MASRGSSKRGSANVNTPSSLTQLLSPTVVTPLAVGDPSLVQALRQQQLYRELARVDPRTTVDRRRYRPAPDPGAVIRSSKRLNVDVVGTAVRSQLSSGIRFARPRDIAICVRRKMRREVLHALRLTSKVGRGGAPRRRNAWSGIKC